MAGALSLGTNSNLFINGSASLQYQSNIFLDDPELSGVGEVGDFTYIFSPGVELNIGDGTAPANILILAREDIKFYNNTQLDTELHFFLFDLTYSETPVDIAASANFFETAQNSADANRVGALTEIEMTIVNIRGEYELTAKTSIEGKFGYFRNNFITPGSSDYRTLEFPVNVYYAYSPKLDVSLGFRYRDTTVTDGPDSEDIFVNVGLRGEVSPKLEATLQIGVQNRDFGTAALGDDTNLAVNSSFTWYVSDLTTVDATFNRDYTTGATTASLQNTGGTVSVLHNFTPMIAANAALSYNNAEYKDLSGREDDTYNTTLSLSYFPNDYLSFTASYNYMKNESTQLGGNFKNNVLNLIASLRY